MSLRIRLTLLITFVVGAALFVAWIVTGQRVIAPFTRQVMKAHVDHVIHVAGMVESGADPAELSEKLGLHIRVFPRPPPFVKRHRRRGGGRCHQREIRGREVVICKGRRAPIAVKLSDRWVVVRRDLDAAEPKRRVGQWLLIIAAFVFAISAWLATRVTKPLTATARAMERMAGGDLAHRLPTDGSRELAEVARSFNAMADRVDSILRAERELMAGISHELRTPLARLRLEVEMLRDHGVPEKRLTAMEADLVEVDELIGELLSISKLSIGEQALNKSETDLRKVVEEALERNPLPKHRVAVTGNEKTIAADHARLVRVVGNLLQNAGKYAPEESEISVHIDGTSVEVADQGPGVPPQDLARLFEPFYRGVRGRTGSTGGLGLGLMIARQVVILHGGEIDARNRSEGGLAIRFSIPT